MADYSKTPAAATLNVRPFKAHVPEDKLQHFKQLLELSPIAPATFENTNAGGKYGTQREWLENAKNVWLNEFNWRSHEYRINSFPNFKAEIQDSWGNTIDMQFLALFSEKQDAVPLVMLHGFPSSICDFLDILDLVRNKYSPAELPYHIIVPSLPGYGYSSGPPLDMDYDVDMAADAINSLMVGLGFGSGYLTQGGDLGSFISRRLALKHDACKGMHVNMMGIPPGINPAELEANSPEQQCLAKAGAFIDTEHAFAILQGQKPSMLGLTLASSPLALLSWVGEKIIAWTDGTPPLERVLEHVMLYWVTESFPRCIWHSRGFFSNDDEKPKITRLSLLMNPTPKALELPYVEKPCGYSLFAGELVPVPKGWAEKSCNLAFFNEHEKGGHFAPAEMPKELLGDVEQYVKIAWK